MRTHVLALALAALAFTPAAIAQPGPGHVDDMALTLLTLREAAGPSVSPDGRQIAFQIRWADPEANTYHAEWRLLDLRRPGETTLITQGGAMPFGSSVHNQQRMAVWLTLAPRWSPDGGWIAYLRRDGELTQIWRARIDGSHAEQVTRDVGSVSDFIWSGDGRTLIYDAGPSDQALRAAFERESAEGFLLDDRFDPVSSWAPIRSNGEVPDPPCCRAIDVVTGEMRDANEAEIERYRTQRPQAGFNAAPGMTAMWSLRSSFEHPPVVAPFEAEPADVRWRRRLANGAAVVFALDRSELRGRNAPVRLHARGAAGAAFTPCSAEACAGWIIEAWRSSNGDIVYLRREGWAYSTFAFYRWRPATGEVEQLSATHDIWFDCEQANDELVCFTEGALTPQTMVALNLVDGGVRELLDFNPDFPRSRLAPVERLEWRSPRGNPDYAYFVRPPAPMPPGGYPLAIVHYRARGFLRGGSGDFSPIQAYAAAGIAVLAVDRPENWDYAAQIEDDREIERLQFENSSLRRDVFAALEIALDQLVERGLVNPNRIGVSGLSDGSASTAFAIIHSDRFRAASISGGAWEPILFLMSSPQQRAFYTSLGIGAPGTADDINWDALSIARNAARITTPLLIQTADSELGMILEPLVMLETHGKPVEAYVFPDEYHVPWQPAHRLAMYRRNIDWFRFWLQDFEDSSPEKAAQYQRWRQMRAPPR